MKPPRISEQLHIKLANIEAFALDFDGTLADTVRTHNAARLETFTRMAEQTGDQRFATILPEIHAEAHNHGSNPQEIIGWILMQAKLAESIGDPVVEHTVALKKDIYKEFAANGLDEIPGATDFVRALARAIPGRIAIVTTAHRDTEVIPFLRRYEDHPAQVASLEDTWRGISAARQAGLTTAAIATTSTREDLEALNAEAHPELVVDNFEQLQAMWDARESR